MFLRLRPLLWTQSNQSYFEQFVLLGLLRTQGISLQWVLGVSAVPYRASSWLQHEEYVVDDDPEVVSAYSPIVAM
jgi:hypothetical protein